jgi:tetratricopeptide (TPR) repeat protein
MPRVWPLLLLIAWLISQAALAETSADYDTCGNEDANIDDRIHACTRIITDAPLAENQSAAYRNRGSAFEDRGQHDLAIADETKAITLNPSDAVAYNLRAWSYLESGDAKKALPDADEAISLNPNFADAYDTRGRIYEALGKADQAAEDYKKALGINPNLDDTKTALRRVGARS